MYNQMKILPMIGKDHLEAPNLIQNIVARFWVQALAYIYRHSQGLLTGILGYLPAE